MFSATTRTITVTVEPRYLEQDSEPEAGRYVWSYRVTIANHGPEPVRLWARAWEITDGHGRVQEIRGIGVVGEQPLIGPGESYTYTSGCPLPTPSGFMRGHYEMVLEDGVRFEAAIPLFPLDRPGARVLN